VAHDRAPAGRRANARAIVDRALAWTRWFVTDEVRAQGQTATVRATAVVLAAPVIALVSIAPALAEWIDGRPTPITPALGAATFLGFALVPLILRWTKSPTWAGAWLLLIGLVGICVPAYMQRGLDSILMVWFVAVPAVAGFFLGARGTLIASLLAGACITGFWVLGALPGFYEPSLRQPEGDAFRWINLVVALVAIGGLGLLWQLAVERGAADRAALEDQVREAQKLESVGMLAGGIAHDFNNILAAILGHASLLEAEVEDPASRRRVGAIVDSAHRAAVLVEQMLAYAGRARTRTGAIELPALVSEVVELVRPGLDKKTELILKLDPETPRLVADPVQIQQIVLNLVTNASEALEGQRGRVFVETRPADADGEPLERPRERPFGPGDFALIEVRDEGCGITPDQLESIFDPFFTTKPSGHGLGLAAVLGIVRSHHGEIAVDSTVGSGTRFRVLLPCPEPATLAEADAEDDAPRPRIRLRTASHPHSQPHPGTASAPSPSARRGAPRRTVQPRPEGPGYVLIVDDEVMVRELAGEVLERAGHRTLLAEDGDDGLRVFEANDHHIDLVVLDRSMPGLDGLELLAEIRRRRPDLPAILSSGYADDAGSRRLKELGVDAVLHKPWAPADLIQVVHELGAGARAMERPANLV
jgi:signal transduction histidine kinase/ActR/RegA family two-component response regulator